MAGGRAMTLAIIKPTTQAIDRASEKLTEYLTELGLPSENVLVAVDQRRFVLENIPGLVDRIEAEPRSEAMYVSKFVAACGAGLFDAALNFIWDEVVQSLRARVARFDLAYFYDTAVPAPERQDFQTEEDLVALSDQALIRGAHACGMLTTIGYKQVDYIRDMRNWASAAHPNQAEVSGIQLTAFFETCLKRSSSASRKGDVLEVGRLLRLLR